MANLTRPKKYVQSASFGDPVVLLARPHKNMVPDSNITSSDYWVKSNNGVPPHFLGVTGYTQDPVSSAVYTSVSTNDALAPNGSLTADKIAEATTVSAERWISHWMFEGSSTESVSGRGITATDGHFYTFSCFVKADERAAVVLGIEQRAEGLDVVSSAHVAITVLGGTPVVGTPTVVGVYTNVTAATQPVSKDILPSWNTNVTGWHRVFLTVELGSSSENEDGFLLKIYPHQQAAYTGVVGNGIHVWGIQFEKATAAEALAGAYQTSRYARQIVKLDRSKHANPSYWVSGPMQFGEDSSRSHTLRSLWVEYIADSTEGSLTFNISTNGGATWSSDYSVTVTDTSGGVNRSRVALGGASYTGEDIRIKLGFSTTQSLVRVVSLIPEISQRGKI